VRCFNLPSYFGRVYRENTYMLRTRLALWNVESMGSTIYRIGHLYRYNGTYSGGGGERGVEECEGWGEMCRKIACNACVCDW